MFDIALGVFLFLSPIIFIFGNNARLNGIVASLGFYQFNTLSLANNVVQLQFFEYGIIALFIIAMTLKPIQNFKDRWFACLLGGCAFSVVMHPKTMSAFIPVFLGFLFYYLVVSYIKDIKKLLYIIVIVSALNTCFAVLQFFRINIIYNLWSGSVVGMMFSPSHLGTYQAIALPICYMINPLLAIIPFIGLLLSKSFTPLLAVTVGMLYLLYPKKNKIFINLAPIGLIAVVGILTVFIFRNYQNIVYKFTLRLGLWCDILKDIIRNPLGSGLGNFSKVTPLLGEWKVPQNEFLGVAFYVGVLSWVFIYMFLKDKFTIAKDNLHRSIFASCLIILIICLGQSPLHFPRLMGTIIPVFAFLEVLKRREKCL